MFVEVAFPISSFQTFSYKVPSKFLNDLHVGTRVTAPLGRRKVQGIVTNLSNKSIYKGQMKYITGVIDEVPVISSEIWALVEWMSQYYITPKGQVAKAVLPASLSMRYFPPKYWYVQPNPIVDEEDVSQLKHRAPQQYKLQQIIWDSKHPVRVGSLSDQTSNPLNVCRILEQKGFVDLFQETSLPDVTGFTFAPIKKHVSFNTDQRNAVDKIIPSLNGKKYSPFLLHGVTGSGKTEIYIEVVRCCLEQDKSAIILLPEISLTPQIAGRFKAVFGDTVALWHSKLTKAQRGWTWKEICRGTFKVVIGARSAIFAPVKKLGLIVIDEEQESSFRQDAPAPRYHARDVALMRGAIEKSTVILSSATPSLESYYNYLKEKLTYLYLPKRFGGAKYPYVHVVNMLTDQEESGKYGLILSGLLQDKIEERLNKNEQVILLQNRRGYSPIIRCSDCGETVLCPYCKISLTYHQQGSKLRCHFCGHVETDKRESCINCGGGDLKYSGAGTQRVESLLQETFPDSNIERLDMDTAKNGNRLTSILENFSSGGIDILLGTQMIAKGLDFPNATLVGIINADLGLHLPDFRTGERIFQLIYQASGRAGRKNKPGEVVIQTYMPDNPVIKSASRLNLMKYYKIALSEREELNYPPFSWMAKVELSGPSAHSVEKLSVCISKSLIKKYKGLDILGPSPCYLEKLRSQYRFQIVFKSLKTFDINGRKLHSFIQDNFIDVKTRFKLGKNKISIHLDPQSLI